MDTSTMYLEFINEHLFNVQIELAVLIAISGAILIKLYQIHDTIKGD